MALIAPLLAFIAVAGWCPEFFSPATDPKWYLASILVPLGCLFVRRRAFPGDLAGILFLLWSGLSVLWALSWPDALSDWWRWMLFGGLVVLGLDCDLRRCVQAYGLGLAVGLIAVWAQFRGLSWAPEYAGNGYPGLLFNPNYAAEASALGLVAAVAFRQWWMIPVCLAGLVASPSRGAVVMVAVAAAFWLAEKGYRRAAWGLIGLGLAAIATQIWLVGFDHPTIAARLSLWLNSLPLLDWTGYGIGSFHHAFPLANDAIVPTLTTIFRFGVYPNSAHNDFLNVAVETGVIGLFLFLWFVLIVVRTPGPGRYLIVAGLADALVNYPLHVPSTAFLLCLAAGRLLGHRHAVWRQRSAVGDGVPEGLPRPSNG